MTTKNTNKSQINFCFYYLNCIIVCWIKCIFNTHWMTNHFQRIFKYSACFVHWENNILFWAVSSIILTSAFKKEFCTYRALNAYCRAIKNPKVSISSYDYKQPIALLWGGAHVLKKGCPVCLKSKWFLIWWVTPQRIM